MVRRIGKEFVTPFFRRVSREHLGFLISPGSVPQELANGFIVPPLFVITGRAAYHCYEGGRMVLIKMSTKQDGVVGYLPPDQLQAFLLDLKDIQRIR